MSEVKKLTSEELENLKAISKNGIELASALGEIEFQLTLLENQKNIYKSKIVDLKTNENSLLASLEQKYGKVTVNLETGELQ